MAEIKFEKTKEITSEWAQRWSDGSRGVAHNAKEASKTFEGISKAMAEQWGDA